MAVNKQHKEFHLLDMTEGWHVPPGYPAGIQQKIISGELDEQAKRGSRTRFLRFDPGVFTTKPFVHEYWEEVYLLSGHLTVGNDELDRTASLLSRIPTPAALQAFSMGRSNPRPVAYFSKSTISIRHSHPNGLGEELLKNSCHVRQSMSFSAACSAVPFRCGAPSAFFDGFDLSIFPLEK